MDWAWYEENLPGRRKVIAPESDPGEVVCIRCDRCGKEWRDGCYDGRVSVGCGEGVADCLNLPARDPQEVQVVSQPHEEAYPPQAQAPESKLETVGYRRTCRDGYGDVLWRELCWADLRTGVSATEIEPLVLRSQAEQEIARLQEARKVDREHYAARRDELEVRVAELEGELADAGRILGQVIAAGTLAPGEDFAEPLDHAAAQSARSVAKDRNRLRVELDALRPIARGFVWLMWQRRLGHITFHGLHVDDATLLERVERALPPEERERLLKGE